MSNLTKALATVERYTQRLINALPEVMVEMDLTAASNLQGAAYDGIGSRPTGISDPTGAAVCSPNRARTDQDEFATHIQTAARHLEEADRIASNYRRGDPAKLRRNLAELAASGTPGCQQHARIGIWVAVHRKGTVAGNLDHDEALCRPCYEFVTRQCRTPSKKELELDRKIGKLRPLTAIAASGR